MEHPCFLVLGDFILLATGAELDKDWEFMPTATNMELFQALWTPIHVCSVQTCWRIWRWKSNHALVRLHLIASLEPPQGSETYFDALLQAYNGSNQFLELLGSFYDWLVQRSKPSIGCYCCPMSYLWGALFIEVLLEMKHLKCCLKHGWKKFRMEFDWSLGYSVAIRELSMLLSIP